MRHKEHGAGDGWCLLQSQVEHSPSLRTSNGNEDLCGRQHSQGGKDWKRESGKSEKSLEGGLAPLAASFETRRTGEKRDGLDRMKFTRCCSDSHQSQSRKLYLLAVSHWPARGKAKG